MVREQITEQSRSTTFSSVEKLHSENQCAKAHARSAQWGSFQAYMGECRISESFPAQSTFLTYATQLRHSTEGLRHPGIPSKAPAERRSYRRYCRTALPRKTILRSKVLQHRKHSDTLLYDDRAPRDEYSFKGTPLNCCCPFSRVHFSRAGFLVCF